MENTLIINKNLRTITIPESVKNLGVESDDGVLRLQFTMPKTYGDIDLSAFNIRINYTNAAGEGDVYPVVDNAVAGDNITFSWLVGRFATKAKGNVKFNVCLRELDEAGEVDREFNTTPAMLPVLEGLETTGAVVQQNPDILEEMQSQLAGAVKTVNGTPPDKNGNVEIETGGGGGSAEGAVLYTEQVLTDEQKAQARANIGVTESGAAPEGSVLYVAQTLTEAQKAQARANIGVNNFEFSKHFTEDETFIGQIEKNNGAYVSANNFRSVDYVYFPLLQGGNVTVKSTIYSYCSVSFYDKNKHFISSINSDNIASYGYTANLQPIERNLPAPAGTVYIRFAIYTTTGVGENDMYISGQVDSVSLMTMNEDAQKLVTISEELVKVITPKYELGDIGIGSSGWSYSDKNSRVRTKQGETVKLYAGDEIFVKNASFYVGWKTTSGYSYKGWIGGGYFIVPEDGEYVLLFRHAVEAEITDIDDFVSRITIKQNFRHGETVKALNDKIGTLNDKIGTLNGMARNFAINPNVKGVNHRGYNTVAPENTMPAFKLSREKGFVYIEGDVDYTSDDELVIIHDTTINRTARNADGTVIEGDIAIHDITYAQALTYDFGIFKGQQYAGTRIPKFEEFIGFCRAVGAHPYIELKFTSRTRTDLIERCCDIVKKYGMAGKTTWIHTEVDTLEVVAQKLPKERLGLVCYKTTLTETGITSLKALKTDANEVFVDCCHQPPLDDVVNLCMSHDIPLEVWTVSSKNDILSLDPYISGVTSNEGIAEQILYEEYM